MKKYDLNLEFDPTFDGMFSKQQIVELLMIQSHYDVKVVQRDENNDISMVRNGRNEYIVGDYNYVGGYLEYKDGGAREKENDISQGLIKIV